MNSNKITNLTPPTATTDAANKSYVDAAEVRATAVGSAAQTTANTAKTTADNLVTATRSGAATVSAQSLYPATGIPVQIITNGAERIYVTPTGNVGIGTSVPSVLLDVAGAAKIAGELNMNSNKIVNVSPPTLAADAANKSYVDSAIPIGGIIMWSGLITADFPSNWKLCDGTNGTPDLRGRFILGAGQGSGLTNRSLRVIGGEETVALSETHMPAHKHGVTATTTGTDGSHTHGHTWTAGIPPNVYGTGGSSWGGGGGHTNGTTLTINNTGSGHGHTITVTETSKGSGTAHENMPPFYVLAFIMRIS